MATFEDLPAPLPLHILKYLPDLKALDSVTRSSLVYMNVLAQHATEVFEYLIQETLLEDIVVEMRVYIISLVRSPRRAQSDSEFEALYMEARNSLPVTTPSAAIFHTLRKFTELASQCDAMLYSKLRHLKALPHQHLAADTRRSGYDPLSAGVPYTIQDPLSPIHFIEQQRMLRAIWRLEIGRRFGNPTTRLPMHRNDDQRHLWLADEVNEVAASVKSLELDDKMSSHNSSPLSWKAMAPMPQLGSESRALDIAWGETLETTIERFSGPSAAQNYFRIASSSRWQRSPLEHADWTVMRRLGIGMWSERRMAEEFELAPYPRWISPPLGGGTVYEHGVDDDHMTRNNKLFTWTALYMAEIAVREGDEVSRVK